LEACSGSTVAAESPAESPAELPAESLAESPVKSPPAACCARRSASSFSCRTLCSSCSTFISRFRFSSIWNLRNGATRSVSCLVSFNRNSPADRKIRADLHARDARQPRQSRVIELAHDDRRQFLLDGACDTFSSTGHKKQPECYWPNLRPVPAVRFNSPQSTQRHRGHRDVLEMCTPPCPSTSSSVCSVCSVCSVSLCALWFFSIKSTLA